MSLKSFDCILRSLENQPLFQELQQFQRLLASWSVVMEPEIRSQTRPIAISRGVLWVATSSASQAQDLTISRFCLLKQLNPHLRSPLVDIRFSTAKWHNRSPHSFESSSNNSVSTREHPHPSPVVETDSKPPVTHTPAFSDAKAAFQHWAELVQARSQHLPLCPQCQCPTPQRELDRWAVCALCATKQWQS